MDILNALLIKKYQPKILDDLILPDRILNKFNKGVYQHFLFHGSPGTGKSSTAFALVNQFKNPYIYINASDETSVDVIRNRITDFCSTANIMGDLTATKIVILDEVDGVSDQFFKALKGTMDKFSKNSRFIATTNFVNTIPEAVRSRFEEVNFDFDKDESKSLNIKYLKRTYEICKNEGISIEKDALLELVNSKFPDFRSILTAIQGFLHDGIDTITLDNVHEFHGEFKELFNLIVNNINPVENYKLLMSEYSNRVDDVLSILGKEFIGFIENEYPNHISKIPKIIIEVAKHQQQRVHVIDTSITMLSLVYVIQTILTE